MKKLSTFLSLAIAATILSGCYVSPYHYQQRPYGYGYQCPPPIQVEVKMKKEKKKEKKKECKPTCKPVCDCAPVYKPMCAY